jgi:hypothetical protein
MTVVITGTRVSTIQQSGKAKLPQDAQVVDAAGKYLVPGLWDMHVHVFSGQQLRLTFPLLIANGVTGVRDMGTYVPLADVNRIRKDIADGKLLGPRIFAAGSAVDGQNGVLGSRKALRSREGRPHCTRPRGGFRRMAA